MVGACAVRSPAPLLALLIVAGSARAATPLSTGAPPTLDWGEHRLDLQVGWPAQAVTLGWGARSGWNLGARASLDLAPATPHWGLGMTFCRPFAHGKRTSGFVHGNLGSLLSHRPGERPRFGGEGQVGIALGVGIGRLRHLTWDAGIAAGMRVGPGLVERVPTLRVDGSMGLSAWLAPTVSIGLRGRAGAAGTAGGAPGPTWSAGAVFTRLF